MVKTGVLHYSLLSEPPFFNSTFCQSWISHKARRRHVGLNFEISTDTLNVLVQGKQYCQAFSEYCAIVQLLSLIIIFPRIRTWYILLSQSLKCLWRYINRMSFSLSLYFFLIKICTKPISKVSARLWRYIRRLAENLFCLIFQPLLLRRIIYTRRHRSYHRELCLTHIYQLLCETVGLEVGTKMIYYLPHFASLCLYYFHTWYLSILVHRHVIKACRSTPKSA